MSTQPEVWRVSTVEGIFETDLETLKQWIVEGCVLPTDKVTKGNLGWIEAGRVPKLKDAFKGDVSSVAPTGLVGPANGSACQNHPEAEPEYVCRMCGAVFCKACPRFAGGTVPVCPLCGDLCREYRAVVEKSARAKLQSSGFGMEDFVRAVSYPFNHKAALLTGALIYALLLLVGFRGRALAAVILFGCVSHVISQVAWGRLNRSFMPDFSAFSYYDDFVSPGLLGLGIMIVSWGPAIALVLALVFGIAGGDGVIASYVGASDGADPLRSVLPYLFSKVWIALLFVLFIGWGIFYYPMALTVAGYTQSFGAVVNPVVGLDTIRRMGTTYFKAFAMVIVVQVVSLVISVIISVVTSPFALPFFGNLVDSFINATFTFYFNLVIACILGLSLFKCADRLDICVD